MGMVNFTPRAQLVMAVSRKEADRLHHNFVGTEHLLLALIRVGQKGTAVAVLGRLGLSLETVRQEIEKQVGAGPDQKLIGNIPFTAGVKRVLALAAKEASALHHLYVGTEHLLLGLLREGDGVAARVFQHFGVNIEKTREEILRELAPKSGEREPGAKATVTARVTGRLAGEGDAIDTSKRYDIYCIEGNQEVVYRDAVFKGRKGLLQGGFPGPEFLEIEQADGQRVFVARASVVKFCEHGVRPG